MPRTISEFVSQVQKSKGFARQNKFEVVITPPSNLKSLLSNNFYYANGQVTDTSDHRWSAQVETGNEGIRSAWNALQEMKDVGESLTLLCDTVTMPGFDLQTHGVQYASEPKVDVVQTHGFASNVAATFYLSTDLRERHFFEQWQKMAVSKTTHKANYYDDYIGEMEIFQLDGNGEITYGIKATEVYPTTIAGIEYAYANTNQIAIQSVNFQYRQWFNMTNDAIEGYSSDLIDYDEGRQRELDKVRAQLDDYQKAKEYDADASSKKRVADRLRRLRPPEIDRQDTNRKSAQVERDRQKHLKKPEVDADQQQLAVKKAKAREERLKKPERKTSDPFHQTQKEFDRQKHLKKPEVDTGSSSTVNLANRNAIARGLGYESAAALKTALRNKAKGL